MLFILCVIILAIVSLLVYQLKKERLLLHPQKGQSEELIVAVCMENINWIDHYAHQFDKVTVYNKCGRPVSVTSPNIKIIATPNIGSCDYAFLSYIIDRYDDLPAFMEFTKGSQVPNNKYHDCSVCDTDKQRDWKTSRFKLIDYHYQNHKSNECKQQEWHDSGFPNMQEWVRSQPYLSEELFIRNDCCVIYGGHFGATAEQVRRTPKKDWEQLRAQQHHPREEVDHYIERMWRVLLCRPVHDFVIVIKTQGLPLEWLRHCRQQGVSHFYLLGNATALQCDNVTVLSEESALQTIKKESMWAMMLDSIDYVYTSQSFYSVADYLRSVPTNIGRIQISRDDGSFTNVCRTRGLTIVDGNSHYHETLLLPLKQSPLFVRNYRNVRN